jgi:hypothetical protein
VKDKRKGREETERTSFNGSTLSLDESDLLAEQQLNGFDAFRDRANRLNMPHQFDSPVSSMSDLSDMKTTDTQPTSGDLRSTNYPRNLKQRYVLRSRDQHDNGGDKIPPWKPSGSAVRHCTGAIPSVPALPRHSQKGSKKDRLVKSGEKEKDGQQLETVALDDCMTTNVSGDGENGHDELAALMDSPNVHVEKQDLASQISVLLKQELNSASLSSTQTVESLHQQAMAEKTRQRATEETELLYLQFISDVTTDILTRGIYSNQALQLLFQSHVEKRKRELDEHILYKKLDQLKLDLGFQ